MGKDVTNVVFLGLGGNLGDRLESIRRTISMIEEHCGKVVKASGVYETQAWGSDSQHKYLNQVVEIETLLAAQELLDKLLNIEHLLGRSRVKQNADRTVDIDILLYNQEILTQERLHVPHPRMHLRKFVLIPLCDIAPDLMHPVFGKNMKVLLNECQDRLSVVKLEE